MGKCKYRNRAQISTDNCILVQRADVTTPGALHAVWGISEQNMSLGAGLYHWEHHSHTGKPTVKRSSLTKSI